MLYPKLSQEQCAATIPREQLGYVATKSKHMDTPFVTTVVGNAGGDEFGTGNRWWHPLSKLLADVKNIYLDGTERSIQWPLHKQEQKHHYSGKKTHTVKHNIICDENRRILCMSKACNGTTHDKKIADEENLNFPEQGILTLFQDTGFQGYSPKNVVIMQPEKKPKGKELTTEQKQRNKQISSKKIKVEHAIGSIKILKIIKDEIRIYKETTRNIVMKIACAIHNLKLKID